MVNIFVTCKTMHVLIHKFLFAKFSALPKNHAPMKKIFYKTISIFLILFYFSQLSLAQGDEPWFNSAAAVWNSNSNMTPIYAPSTSWTAFTSTSQASIGNPSAACDASATNDQWLRIPHNGCNNIRIVVNWENTNTVANRTVRFAVYRGTTCTSSSCPLTLLGSQCFTTGTTSDCFGNALQTRTLDVSYTAGEFIFVRLWDEANSSSSRATVYAICGASSTPSTPNNEDCATPIYITNSGGCAGTNWNAPSGGFSSLGSTNCSWGVNENPVFYEFTATASTMTLNVEGVRCFGSACNGLGSSLQFAVFPRSSPCSSIPASSRLNAVGNAAQDCYIGVGIVGGQFSGLVAGQRYLIILDGLNGARCSWTGVSIDNAAPLPTVSVNNASICASASTTLTVNGLQSGQTVSWTASPADPSLTTPNSSTIIVSPTTTTTYTATVNLGTNARLCNGQFANALPLTATVDVLNPNGTRLAPNGAQCSGTLLNFTANPTGGNGLYSYSWSTTNPASFTGSGQNFSPTPVNTSCNDQLITVTLNVTSNGRTCPRTFSPTIRPIPQLTAFQTVDCFDALVDLADANVNSCACINCIYTLTACTGCNSNANPLGTSNSNGLFSLSGATSASFTSSLNGCTGNTHTVNFLSAPYNCTLLPIELSNFEAKCGRNTNNLNWTTEFESNNDFFIVERSLDGIEFNSVGMLDASGDSDETRHYSFNDNLNGMKYPVLYYRLRQQDFDATVSYSRTIALSCSHTVENINIYPNPANNLINIEISGAKADKIKILSVNGQLLLEKNCGTNNFEIDLSDFSDGNYIIQILGNSFSHTQKLTIIK
jgi:hypothetical protein